LAKYFGVTTDYLLGFDITPPGVKLDADEAKLIDCYRSVNEEGQEKIADYADDILSSGKYKKDTSYGVLRKEA